MTGIARHPETIAALPGVTAKNGDVFNKPGLAALLKAHDAVVSAVHFTASDPELLIEAVKTAGVKRYFVVGGAGSLEVAPGVKLIDTPQFPAAHKAEAAKGGEFLDLLRKENDLEWTFLSPSAMIAPGERTGKFRLGKDDLLTNEKVAAFRGKTTRSRRSTNWKSRPTSGSDSRSDIEAQELERGGKGSAPASGAAEIAP